jgi:hypothetical protein
MSMPSCRQMSGIHVSIFGCIYLFIPVYLNFENFAEIGQTGNKAVCPFSVIENTITIQ